MALTRVITFPNTAVKVKVITFVSLVLISSVTPFFIHSQWITGPLVNAVLFISVVLLGPYAAALIGLGPSTVALSSGLLPLALSPMVPFIMISNTLLVGVFYLSQKKGFTFSVIGASIIKFIFLYSIVTFVMQTMLADPLITKLSIIMTWPQLYTALIGGVIAFGFLKLVKKI